MSFGGQVTSPILPVWIRGRKMRLGELHEIKKKMRQGGLHTVCEEARCPNRSECFSRGTATFLINGRVCTRNCAYCSIANGRPQPVDPEEPRQLMERARAMELQHVVITAVDRDDLPDGGAAGFVDCISALRELPSTPTIEVLTPDFRGDMAQVDDASLDLQTHRRLLLNVRLRRFGGEAYDQPRLALPFNHLA